MPDNPTVSVILPVHNRQDLVSRAIDSVLAQTMENLELLIIDDASTDGTPEVIGGYASDPRVRVCRNQTNLGAAGARNRGIEAARGTYIAFQDSDDRWFPEKLALQVAALEKQQEARACFCGALYYSAEHCYYIPDIGISDGLDIAAGDLSRVVLSGNPITPQTLLLERSVFDETGPFDAGLSVNEDWELAIRMAQKVRFAFLPDPLVVIYRTADSVSSDRKGNASVREEMLRRYRDLFDKAPKSRALQHYIIGCIWMENGAHRKAIEHLQQAFRSEPSSRRFLQIQRARLLRLLGTK